MKRKKLVELLEEVKAGYADHLDCEYMLGLYNGVEVALCHVDDREPEFVREIQTTRGNIQ